MMRARLFLSASAAVMVMGLAACDPTEFNSELGSEVDNGTFGNPTMNNELVMTGKIDAQVALGQRFANEVPTTITFAFNSSDLTPETRAVLHRQANWIRQFPEVRFRVYGYTDLVGSNAYNKALGLRRAKAVVAYFASEGISTSRLEAGVSYGKTHPVIQTPGPEQRNRRTVTEVSGFVENNPMVINGKYAAIIMRNYLELGERPHPGNTKIKTQVNTTE